MIEILCTITGIVAGVAIVASLMQGRGSRTQQFVRRSPSDDAPESAQMHGIADQLRLLSFRVAADVTAHSEKVEAINGRLAEPDSGPPQLLSAINELIAANQTMQGQLADARKRIAHQSEMIEEAAQLARTDALTGLANRRALNEFLQNCLGAIRPGEFAGLLLMDIDHFKTFNDDYGHTTGDAVLAAFARNIKKWCNHECYPARYGGEEFAVILTGRDQKAIAQKSSDLRKFVSEQTITFEDLQLSITASAGLCILAVGDSLQSAYDRSDEGLYNAKKSGRNCGFWLNDSNWEPLPEPSTQTFTTTERKRVQSAEELIRESQQRANRPDQPSDPEKLMRSDAGSEPKSREDEREEAVESVRSVRQDAAYGDVLDKETFTTRMTSYLEQLRKADLPATGVMIAAVGCTPDSAESMLQCWAAVQSLIQSQLRGIDVMCRYEDLVGCAFLPGCSTEAAVERGGRLQALLEDARTTWPENLSQPTRMAVAIATARANENAEQFLARLNQTLAQTAEAAKFEIAIHDGQRVVLEGAVGV